MDEHTVTITRAEFDTLRDGFNAAQREVERLSAEVENLRATLKDICEEWNEDCDPQCDSHGHTETCKATNIANAKRAMLERAEAAEQRAAELQRRLDAITGGTQ